MSPRALHRFDLVWLLGCSLLVISCLTGCSGKDETGVKPSEAVLATDPRPALFSEMTDEVQLNAVHDPGPFEVFPMPQIMGSGGGLLDANGDGRLDILLIPGAASKGQLTALCPLWLQSESGKFVDSTETAQLRIRGYGMGLTVGDVDNDSDDDVFITTDGEDHLFLNDGRGVFIDITIAAGISDPRWSAATAFLDYDADGWLDLFVINYLDYFPGSVCQDPTGRRDYCGPATFNGTVDRLYHNSGVKDGCVRYEDVTTTSGLSQGIGKGLGAICSDLTGDGRVDIYVANDQEANRLWVQQPDGKFIDEALVRGCAVDFNGSPQASMGTALGDIDRDGLMDIMLTHLRGETNTLYRNHGDYFEDNTAATGLGQPSLNFTGFGVGLFDIEHDGDIDCVVVNGRVMRSPFHQPTPADTHWKEYSENNQVFLNGGTGIFTQWENRNESFTQRVEISRGLSYGDIDQDGDLDLLVTQIAGRARVYRNDSGTGHWLQIRARTTNSVRDAVGTRVVLSSGSSRFVGELQTSMSYLSSHGARIHFGLGELSRYEALDVTWPSGSPRQETFPGGETNQQLTIVQGTGMPRAKESTP